MIEAVIFDMDGLMFDSETVWLKSWEIALAQKGLELDPRLFGMIAGANRESCLETVDELYGGDPLAIQAAEDHFRVANELFRAEGAPMKEGLCELLDYLESRNTPKAIASSSSDEVVSSCLLHANVQSRFPVVATGDLGLPSKPAPDLFLFVARALGVEPRSTIVLEDSGNGIRAAHAGGFIPVWIPDIAPLCESDQALAQYAFGSLLQVPGLVDQLNAGC